MKRQMKNTKTLAAALSLFAMSAFIGCSKSSSPISAGSAEGTDIQQQYNSEGVADMTASGAGDATGGGGMVLDDAMTLGQGKTIQSTDQTGGFHVTSRNETYDSVTKQHSIIFTREKSWTNNLNSNTFTYNGQWTYRYTFYDANGVAMASYQKGITNSIAISELGGHTILTPRVEEFDSSDGNWTIAGFVNQSTTPPVVNGTYNQRGTDTLTSKDNNQRILTHSYTINYTNDELFRDSWSGFVYLVGSGTSNFTASDLTKNVTIDRSTVITFNNDGTAQLVVTRTSGNGKTDTFTFDVRQGILLTW